MVYLITAAGLVALLGALLYLRSAQQDVEPPTERTTESTTAAPSSPTGPPTRSTPPPAPDPRFAGRSAEYDHYLRESRRIARRGESRAATLDFFGYLVSGVAALIVGGVVLAVATNDEGWTTDERVAIALGVCGSVLALVAIAAMFFGFGALVRNSSRSLSISAGTALDSFGPPDED